MELIFCLLCVLILVVLWQGIRTICKNKQSMVANVEETLHSIEELLKDSRAGPRPPCK